MRLTSKLAGSFLALSLLAGCGGILEPNDPPPLTAPNPADLKLSITLTQQPPNVRAFLGSVKVDQAAPEDLPISFQISGAPNVVIDFPFGGPSEIFKGKTQLTFVLLTDLSQFPPGDSVVTVTATSPLLPGQSVQAQVTVTIQ